MKRTIEIEDNLDEIIEGCKGEIKELIRGGLGNREKLLSYSDLNELMMIHEIIECSLPLTILDIFGLFYLHMPEIERAFYNNNCDWFLNDDIDHVTLVTMALCCYIEEQIIDWYSELTIEDFKRKESEVQDADI